MGCLEDHKGFGAFHPQSWGAIRTATACVCAIQRAAPAEISSDRWRWGHWQEWSVHFESRGT